MVVGWHFLTTNPPLFVVNIKAALATDTKTGLRNILFPSSHSSHFLAFFESLFSPGGHGAAPITSATVPKQPSHDACWTITCTLANPNVMLLSRFVVMSFLNIRPNPAPFCIGISQSMVPCIYVILSSGQNKPGYICFLLCFQQEQTLFWRGKPMVIRTLRLDCTNIGWVHNPYN